MAIETVNNTSTTGTSASSSSLTATSAAEASDRFLKLLVTQMKNQDPLNPLDNAEVTSQMAQISTVTGIENLNSTVSGLNAQFLQLQTMQGAALVGHDVAFEGNTLRQSGAVGDAGFELSSASDKVKVEITGADGTVLDTLEFKGLAAGRHDFTWDIPTARQGDDLTFKVTATAGTADVKTMSLQHETIRAVSTLDNTLALELGNGERLAYDAVWAFL
ncbi:flagellar hook assembly protein FlgD [Ideonella sp.]|uniref:flagellar hook assembly protein FlgD n=1 Tax=Ideonella sp. TaxID=1929293 RepID=UPI003BB4EA34